ncbi:MAG TPA: hypothetical protein VGC40_09130 [Paenirhodobacter sp.]
MTGIASIRRSLEKLTVIAKARNVGNPLLPRSQWHPESRARQEAWTREIAENGHDYIWYLENYKMAPGLPPVCYKPQYRHLASDASVEVRTEIYNLIKGIGRK